MVKIMKKELKALCQISVKNAVEKYGVFSGFSDFLKYMCEVVEWRAQQLQYQDEVVFVSDEQVSDVLDDMSILSTIEEMEADGVINRNDYVHDGFFFAEKIFDDMDSIIQSPISVEQAMRFCPY
jgi:hypothetical protein